MCPGPDITGTERNTAGSDRQKQNSEETIMSYTAAVITISDKGSRGERVDTSGPALVALLQEDGYDVVHTGIIPDDKDRIMEELIRCADEQKISLILTTGGTGFSPRDNTPEATMAVVEKETVGIPELMRAESCRITDRGCLSRGKAGIRGSSLIVNLPGSLKAARENYEAVRSPLQHGMDMLNSAGSADCGEEGGHHHHHHHHEEKKAAPSVDAWLKEAKADPSAAQCGMYLTHNGVVRETARSRVREGAEDTAAVTGMQFSYNREKVEAAIEAAKQMPGIFYVRVWLNEGTLQVGDDIMFVLIGGDIRPRVIDALQALVGEIKSHCVAEREVY